MTQIPSEPDRDSPETVASEPTVPPREELPGPHRLKAPDLKTPSGSQRMKYTLFSPETRTGRFLRGLVRALALLVGLFALGLLAAYLLLYRPTQQQLKGMQLQATQTSNDLQKARKDGADANQRLQVAVDQAAQAKEQLETEVARVQILRAINSVTLAQMAIQGKNKAGAVKSLDTAQGYLQAVQPLLEKRDAGQASTLQALFTLAKNDLNRDLKLASQDLERLQSELQRAEANILK